MKLLLSLLLAAVAAHASAKPLNILVLHADDWRHDTLGVAGNPVVKTPNLDRLAGQGVRFTQNCVTTSICGVSRASLFTGQWMSRHGNRAMKAFKTPWAETYPGRLRDHGYFVGHIGKWHNGAFPAANFDFGRSYHHNAIRIPASEALVRKDWKYFYWPEYQLEQLFHVAADPFEENDLAGAPAHAAILTEMRARFAELKAAAK